MQNAFSGLGLTPPPAHRVLSVVGLSLTEAFAVLANLFQMTVTDVSNAKTPIISISKGS